MYRIKGKFAWKRTTVHVKLTETSSEDVEISLDYYYIIQKSYDGEHWTDMGYSAWYTHKEAYEVMRHLICKESEVPVIEQLYHKN